MDIYEQIKSRVSMRDVLEMYGIVPVRGNNIYKCFIHNDNNPSANIIKDCDKFHCFSCQWTGDIFDVVEHFEKCNRKEAMKIIDSKFDLGLMKQLTHKEKLALARQQKERERQKAEKLKMERFERCLTNKIVEEIRFWENVQKDAHMTRGEYRRNEWLLKDCFFTAIKKQEWLNWLYDVIRRFEHPACEYDVIYGTDKDTIIQAIMERKIKL